MYCRGLVEDEIRDSCMCRTTLKNRNEVVVIKKEIF